MARISSRHIVKHDIHSSAAGRETGQLAEARSDPSDNVGFFGGLGSVLFGAKALEVPEEVNKDRERYIDEVKTVFATKDGMVPGQTYQEDLKNKMKALMKKSKEYRTMSGPDLLKLIEKKQADESPFQGDRLDRLEMKISNEVKEIQIEKVTRKYDMAVFANKTEAAPSLRDARQPPPAPATKRLQGGMKRAVSTRREVKKNSSDAGHQRQRSIKFADEEATKKEDVLTDLPIPSAPPPPGPGFLTRMFSGQGDGLGEGARSKS